MALRRRRHRHLVLTARAARLGRFARMRFPPIGRQSAIHGPRCARLSHARRARHTFVLLVSALDCDLMMAFSTSRPARCPS